MRRCDGRLRERLGVVLAAAILLAVASLGLVAACWRRGSALALVCGVVGVAAGVAAGVTVTAARDATDELAGSFAATMIGTVLLVIGQVVQRLLGVSNLRPLACEARSERPKKAQERGWRPEELEYRGSTETLQQVWVALRVNLRKVLEHVTVADVAAGRLPKDVLALTRHEEAWQTR